MPLMSAQGRCTTFETDCLFAVVFMLFMRERWFGVTIIRSFVYFRKFIPTTTNDSANIPINICPHSASV